MLERVAKSEPESPAICFREAIAHQREMLTDLLTVPMYKVARRMGPLDRVAQCAGIHADRRA
jgi:hypothetical protein